MNPDQQHLYGLPDWHLPSPTSTPSSATALDSSYHTPGPEAFQSHFYDAWSTPQPIPQQTPTQTPLFPPNGDRGRSLSSYSHRSQDLEDPEFHINHYSPNSALPLPPVELSRRLLSSPTPLKPAHTLGENTRALPFAQAVNAHGIDTSQMQTPPPTRDDGSSARKRYQDSRPLDFSTPSALINRRQSAPAIPTNTLANTSFAQDSSLPIFHGLQFTPEMSRFANIGPSTITAPSQTGTLLSPVATGSFMHLEPSTAENDPFAFTPKPSQAIFQWPGPMPAAMTRVDSASMSSADDSWTRPPSMLAAASANLQIVSGTGPTKLGDPFVPTTSGVDPSLLFTFGETAPAPLLSNTCIAPEPVQQARMFENRRPYEQQAREVERLQEAARKFDGYAPRTNTTSSAFAVAASHSGLQRRCSHSGLVSRQPLLDSSPYADPRTVLPPMRKTSPLKRTSRSFLTAISEHVHARPKPRLVVDESGRARAETMRDTNDASSPLDHRVRYSSLWDDGSDSESDEGSLVVSRRASFGVPSGLARSASKVCRTSGVSARSNMTENTRAFSFTDHLARRLKRLSTAATNAAKSGDKARKGSFTGPFDGHLRRQPRSTAEGGQDHDGDAQDALRKVVANAKKQRQETIIPADSPGLGARNEYWKASADVSKMTFGQGCLYDPFLDTMTPTEATDGSAFTPETEQSDQSTRQTRCICQSTECDGQPMIQCTFCNKWQHARCLGFPSTPDGLPSLHVCYFCTVSTPVTRSGSSLGPDRLSHIPTSSSPLARKHRRR